MRIQILSGSIPPDVCGVGDYSMSLSCSLNKSGCVVSLDKLNIKSFFRILKNSKKSITHIQYPSKGYGVSLLPQLLTILVRPVVTIHEYSQVNLLRKIAEVPFFIFSKKIIVTTDHEKDAISKIWSRLRRKIIVIPVLPAFMPKEGGGDNVERSGITFFGLMRKGKGVEEFIKLSRMINNELPSVPINIYSAVPDDSYFFFKKIKSEASDLNVSWYLNRPLTEVSDGLSNSKYSYLFFPDGVSDRRSSFIAGLGHGVLMLSNSGGMTTADLKSAFVDVSSPTTALEKIVELENNYFEYKRLRNRGLKIFEIYTPENIASMHVEVYKDIKCQK